MTDNPWLVRTGSDEAAGTLVIIDGCPQGEETMMADKQPMQASGDGGVAGNDGVSEPKGDGEGGAYPNPHSGKKPKGFDGGQSDKRYRGSEDNPNATTK